jgi:hypothetical protein
MLLLEITEVLKIEPVVPIGQHRRMIVGPANHSSFGSTGTIRPKGLISVDPYGMAQAAMKKPLVTLYLANILYRLLGRFF